MSSHKSKQVNLRTGRLSVSYDDEHTKRNKDNNNNNNNNADNQFVPRTGRVCVIPDKEPTAKKSSPAKRVSTNDDDDDDGDENDHHHYDKAVKSSYKSGPRVGRLSVVDDEDTKAEKPNKTKTANNNNDDDDDDDDNYRRDYAEEEEEGGELTFEGFQAYYEKHFDHPWEADHKAGYWWYPEGYDPHTGTSAEDRRRANNIEFGYNHSEEEEEDDDDVGYDDDNEENYY